MRFTARSAQTKTSASTADDVLQLGGTALPQKAEPFFGARTRLGRKKSVKAEALKEGFEKVPNDQQRSSGILLRAQEALLDTQQSLPEDMPERKAKLNVWPNVERENRSATEVRNLHLYYPPARPGIPPRKTSSSAVNDYYDPSKHPYYVTQQTSASAVRDMGLHKASPMTLHETASDPVYAKRPLKPALKKQSSPESKKHQQPDTSLRVKTASSEKKPRKLDLSQFFPQPKAHTRNLLSPQALSRSPSALTDNSDFSRQETVHVQLKRPAANAPYTTHKTLKPPPVDSSNTARPKVFERDIFDRAKTHVRRPPKGIQNWFDGFDISSEEEFETETKQHSPQPQELPADDIPPGFSPWHIKPDSEQPRLDRKASRDPVEDNLLAIEHAKERMQERMRLVDQLKGNVDSGTIASAVSSEVPDRKRGGGSRLALLELASQSVLSLSDSSGDEKVVAQIRRDNVDDVSIMATASSGLLEPPERIENKPSMPRESMSRQSSSTVQTTQTSGSIPIRLTDSIPLPNSRALAEAKRGTQTSYSDPTAQAQRKLTGQATPDSARSRRTTKTSAQDYDTVDSRDTSSSMPSDASHVMAVTEEEMILLEMMRNKRAAMQNNSFAEGYQLALKREQELMVKRRESAQQTALKILKEREDRMKSQRHNRVIDTQAVTKDVDEQHRRKYSATRKEEVDKALKLENFPADMKTPTVDEFPEPPMRADTAEEPNRRPPQKFELLLPSVYSPTPSRMLDASSRTSAEGSSPPPESEDIEDHHHRVRQFLASSSASESTGALPTPPSASSKVHSRCEKRRSIMSPSPVFEEEPVPEGPALRHRRHSPTPDTKERRLSISGRRLSSQLDFDPLTVERASALPAPLRQTSHTHQPYHLTPNFDFSPLEFPPSQLTASPSLSTSRASPLTPTFIASPPSEKPTVEGAYNSSDNASLRGRGAYTPDTELNSLSALAAPTFTKPASSRKRGGGGAEPKKVLPRLNTIVSTLRTDLHQDHADSMASLNSAGEDVLAAWVSLGGGTEALASRRRAR